jgi:hypothetical protein
MDRSSRQRQSGRLRATGNEERAPRRPLFLWSASRSANAGLLAVVLLAALLTIAYTAFAGGTVYQGLENGRSELTAAQAALTRGERSADPSTLGQVAGQLKRAEQDFSDARARAQQDPALRVVAGLPWSGGQLDATVHLAAIGTNLSRAGEGAAAVAQQVASLRKQYSSRALGADDLQAILNQADGIAAAYKGSIAQIGTELRAAHAERTQVTTTGLVPPLQQAYNEVDRALDDADAGFVRYQDVRAVLSDLLGVSLTG